MTSDCVAYGQIEMIPRQVTQQKTTTSEGDGLYENIDTFPQKLVNIIFTETS